MSQEYNSEGNADDLVDFNGNIIFGLVRMRHGK